MGTVNARQLHGLSCLYMDFRYKGKRYRKQTTLEDTPANRKRLAKKLAVIEAEITVGTFNYERHFKDGKGPESDDEADYDGPTLSRQSQRQRSVQEHVNTPHFRDLAREWMNAFDLGWRRTHRASVESRLERHILPVFGDREVGRITRAEVLQFRADVAKLPGRNGNETLNHKTVNDIFGTLSAILGEAANQFQFTNPCTGIKRLPVRRIAIQPFTLDEINLILENVRSDYRDYLTVRFFTGMRSGEIHGLKWQHVDLDNREILVRETYTHGATDYTKTDGSQRDIYLSQPVVDALERQARITGGRFVYVFCTRNGQPISTENFTKRVWYPLLRYLGLPLRRPYQTRHTAATLWLASGENPEWVARQLGHTTTEMLFRTYSRYIPNVTRRDGSAFERLVTTRLGDALTYGESDYAND